MICKLAIEAVGYKLKINRSSIMQAGPAGCAIGTTEDTRSRLDIAITKIDVCSG